MAERVNNTMKNELPTGLELASFVDIFKAVDLAVRYITRNVCA